MAQAPLARTARPTSVAGPHHCATQPGPRRFPGGPQTPVRPLTVMRRKRPGWQACPVSDEQPTVSTPSSDDAVPAPPPPTAEHARLAESHRADSPWRLWGPYLAGRQWGTVREDYSANGDAWSSFPFD